MNTKQIITDSFVQLVHEASFNKITTQMILDRSGVARSTFYRYFKDKYDVMTWYYQEFANGLTELYKFADYRILLEKTAIFLKDNKTYFEKIALTTGANSFSTFLDKIMTSYFENVYMEYLEKEELSIQDYYQISVLVGGFGAALKMYIINGCSEDPQKVADCVFEFLPSLSRYLLIVCLVSSKPSIFILASIISQGNPSKPS